MGKWLAGIIAAIITGVIVWWLTHPGGFFNPNPEDYIQLSTRNGVVFAQNISNDVLYIAISYRVVRKNGEMSPCGYSGVRILPKEEKRLACDFVFVPGTYEVVDLGYAIYDSNGKALYIKNVAGRSFHRSIPVR